MSVVEASYDTQSGKFLVKIDGKKVPNVQSVNISAPPGYDDDLDDKMYGGVYCSICTTEQVGDLRRSITYTTAASNKAKELVKKGMARASKVLKDFVVSINKITTS